VTDGRTDRQTDGQNYDSQDRAEHSSRGKNDTDSVIASLQSTLLSLVMDLCRYSAAADRRIAYVRTHARPVGPTVATTVASCEHRIGDRLTMITEEETFRTSEV